MKGKIMKGIAGFYYVHCDNEITYECKAKGIFRKENLKPLVGDLVEIDVLDEKEKTGSIREILPRTNKLFRPAVANIDQAAIVFACRDPKPNGNLLDRFLITMEYLDVPTIICFTKSDLAADDEVMEFKRIYEAAGYPVCVTNIYEENSEMVRLKELLKGKVTAFAGPSGVGKSSLLNHLHPDAGMETGEVSEKIRRGRHTTRHSELFYLGEQTYLFDTPGFSSLEFSQMDKEKMELYFPEMHPFLGQCRFHGCTHISEPDCAVKEALQNGQISISRYENYCSFYKELASLRKY
ncbi:MAG: ribosome small subunit-dependent GTPase A [Lachnospiraceae bacterium]|nr:ribosome small subunit-dependent GTPase A [Lachnospiraceae bacterium]